MVIRYIGVQGNSEREIDTRARLCIQPCECRDAEGEEGGGYSREVNDGPTANRSNPHADSV